MANKRVTGGIGLLVTLSGLVMAGMVGAAAAAPTVFPPRIEPTPTRVPSSPVLSRVTNNGTCSSHSIVFEYSDVDGDAVRVEQLDRNGRVIDSATLTRGSGTFIWSGWSCSNATGCTARFQIVDRTGRTSRVVENTINCR